MATQPILYRFEHKNRMSSTSHLKTDVVLQGIELVHRCILDAAKCGPCVIIYP